MNCRIITIGEGYPEVLLYRDTLSDENDFKDVVVVQVYDHRPSDLDDIQWRQIEFPTITMCKDFIRDYSIESAKAFCEDLGLTQLIPTEN